MFLFLLTVSLLAVLAVAVVGFFYLPLLPAIAFTVIGIPFLFWLVFILFGLWKKSQSLRPFDADKLARDAKRIGGEGRYVKLPDGRILEYLVYGSKDADAKVIVQMHPQGGSAGVVCRFTAKICRELNVKGIAPSCPGHGFSDIHVNRTIADFPKDLEVVLEAEGVREFMVEGMSLGTPHAMAIARYFGPDRCVALGLNVPYLSATVCREFNLRNDADHLPRPDARAWYQAWNFVVAEILFRAPLISPMARLFRYLPEGKLVYGQRPWVFEAFAEDNARTTVRGTQGQGYEFFSYEKLACWGFDPRELDTKRVAVWYATDDSQSPSAHGEWLANVFTSRADVKTHVRCESAGLGHFTYTPSRSADYEVGEQSIVKALLDLCADI